MARDVASAVGTMGGAKERKKPPKVLEHIRIHPKMGGGVTVAHHYTSFEHEPKNHNFEAGQHSEFHEHIAQHTGMPMDASGESASDEPHADSVEE